MTSTLRVSSANTIRTKPTTGDTKTTFINVDHIGWLKCDGRALDTIQYNLLFQVIGYTFGGSGNTFNLPDAQGRVIGNVGTIVDTCNPSGVAFPAGTVTGEVTHKLTVAEMPAHNHNNAAGSIGANTTAAGTTSSYTHDHNVVTSSYTHNHGSTTSSYTHNHGGTTGDGGNAPESEGVTSGINTASVSGSGTHNHSISSDTHNHTITSDTHNHNITSDTHTHTIASNGGDACHNNMQPTLFYGNLFVYSGIPINGVPFAPKIARVLI